MRRTILQRIADGDPTAVRACLDEYANTIWAIASRYLTSMGEDVDDAVQEIFVEVWKSAGRFDPTRGSEPAFIATIAHRRLINRQRRAARTRTVAIANIPEPSEKPSLKDPQSLHEEAKAAAAAFERLSDDERQLLHLSIHYGLSHERIARATDLPLGTVKTRIRRGLIRLREMLGQGSGAGPNSGTDRGGQTGTGSGTGSGTGPGTSSAPSTSPASRRAGGGNS